MQVVQDKMLKNELPEGCSLLLPSAEQSGPDEWQMRPFGVDERDPPRRWASSLKLRGVLA